MARTTPPLHPAPSSSPARRRLLILGPVQGIPELLGEATGASAVLAPFAALDAGLLLRARPDVVLARVAGTGPDLFDLAERLSDLGYRGPLRCYCRPLPRRDALLASLAETFPGLTVEIVETAR